jgi:hypothetical protein
MDDPTKQVIVVAGPSSDLFGPAAGFGLTGARENVQSGAEPAATATTFVIRTSRHAVHSEFTAARLGS